MKDTGILLSFKIIFTTNPGQYVAIKHPLLLIVTPINFSGKSMSEDIKENDIVSILVEDRDGNWHNIEVPGDLGLNVMEACKASDLSMESICGGMGLCGHCHVYVLSDHTLSPISEQEEETLDKLTFLKSNSRLSCQIHVDERIDGLKVHMAPSE